DHVCNLETVQSKNRAAWWCDEVPPFAARIDARSNLVGGVVEFAFRLEPKMRTFRGSAGCDQAGISGRARNDWRPISPIQNRRETIFPFLHIEVEHIDTGNHSCRNSYH